MLLLKVWGVLSVVFAVLADVAESKLKPVGMKIKRTRKNSMHLKFMFLYSIYPMGTSMQQ